MDEDMTEMVKTTRQTWSTTRSHRRSGPVTGVFDGQVKRFGQNLRIDEELVSMSFNVGHVLSRQ